MMRACLTMLLLSVAGVAVAEQPKPVASRDKIVCKRFTETGSLVRGYRVCKSKAEWERDRDLLRASVTGGGPCNKQVTGAGAC